MKRHLVSVSAPTLLVAAFCGMAMVLGCGASNGAKVESETETEQEAVEAGSETAAESPESEETGAELPPDPLSVPRMPRVAPGLAGVLGTNYWYIPYAVTTEEQGLAFVKAYRDVLEAGKEPPDTLKVEEGKGAAGGDSLYRLREGVTDVFIRDINNPAASAVSQSEIPVMIAQPRPGENGANVLFLDGHVEFLTYGEFPMTKAFISALAKLDPPEWAEEKTVDTAAE